MLSTTLPYDFPFILNIYLLHNLFLIPSSLLPSLFSFPSPFYIPIPPLPIFLFLFSHSFSSLCFLRLCSFVHPSTLPFQSHPPYFLIFTLPFSISSSPLFPFSFHISFSIPSALYIPTPSVPIFLLIFFHSFSSSLCFFYRRLFFHPSPTLSFQSPLPYFLIFTLPFIFRFLLLFITYSSFPYILILLCLYICPSCCLFSRILPFPFLLLLFLCMSPFSPFSPYSYHSSLCALLIISI
jgi:hypothetical protein